jgi:hypothetical protein
VQHVEVVEGRAEMDERVLFLVDDDGTGTGLDAKVDFGEGGVVVEQDEFVVDVAGGTELETAVAVDFGVVGEVLEEVANLGMVGSKF